MSAELIIASNRFTWKNEQIDTNFLRRNNFYKVLSLVEASRACLKIPSTLLLLDMNKDILNYFARRWKLPLMIRMEYASLPRNKALGGIPVYSLISLYNVAEFLLHEGYHPIFHPHLDRFKDIYSVGLLIEVNRPEVNVEIVGKGFDASDLRLGDLIPHEIFKIDVSNFSVSERKIISQREYLRQRNERIQKIVRLFKYIEYVNKENKLLTSLDSFGEVSDRSIRKDFFVPESYLPLSKNLLSSLKEIISILYLSVVRHLPSSNGFVASLSYLHHKGWVLWDVYGQWYKR